MRKLIDLGNIDLDETPEEDVVNAIFYSIKEFEKMGAKEVWFSEGGRVYIEGENLVAFCSLLGDEKKRRKTLMEIATKIKDDGFKPFTITETLENASFGKGD